MKIRLFRWRKSGLVPAAAAIGLFALIGYYTSLSAPFIFDDTAAVVNNPAIRHLGPIRNLLSPESAEVSGVTGRPLVNLSYAINYGMGGLKVEGYHAVNLAIHILAGLTLFGIARRTLRITGSACARIGPTGKDCPPSGEPSHGYPGFLAFSIALIWTVHPLQTESVTCIMQRTESLMGLFYLLTLYCFIRFVGAGHGWAWLSVLSCLFGMASKEVMATAPVVVFLFDRTFVAGSFAASWSRRRGYYGGLAATWLLLAYLVIREGGARGTSAGFGHGVAWWEYSLTQCWAIVHYLRLSIWPYPLILDYGTDLLKPASEAAPQAILLGLLLIGTIVALRRRPVLGFLGASFFLLLAPSSSVIPLTAQTVAEHRMYLPLIAVVAISIAGVDRLIGRECLVLCLGMAIGFEFMTISRNRDYRSEIAIWSQTVARRPGNPRAHNYLGGALLLQSRNVEAIGQFKAALRLKPNYAEADNNLGDALRGVGKLSDAIASYRQAVELRPDVAEFHDNLGLALDASGLRTEAILQLQDAVGLEPENAEANNNLGVILASTGRLREAVGRYEQALRVDPANAEAHANLGAALADSGHMEQAIVEYKKALFVNPNFANAHQLLGLALRALGRSDEAQVQFREAANLRNPGSVPARGP